MSIDDTVRELLLQATNPLPEKAGQAVFIVAILVADAFIGYGRKVFQ